MLLEFVHFTKIPLTNEFQLGAQQAKIWCVSDGPAVSRYITGLSKSAWNLFSVSKSSCINRIFSIHRAVRPHIRIRFSNGNLVHLNDDHL